MILALGPERVENDGKAWLDDENNVRLGQSKYGVER